MTARLDELPALLPVLALTGVGLALIRLGIALRHKES